MFRINNITQNIEPTPDSTWFRSSIEAHESFGSSPNLKMSKKRNSPAVLLNTAERLRLEKIRQQSYSKLSKDDIIRRKVQVQRQVLEARRLNKKLALPEYESEVKDTSLTRSTGRLYDDRVSQRSLKSSLSGLYDRFMESKRTIQSNMGLNSSSQSPIKAHSKAQSPDFRSSEERARADVRKAQLMVKLAAANKDPFSHKTKRRNPHVPVKVNDDRT